MLKFLYTHRLIEYPFFTSFKTGIDYKNSWFSLKEPQILPIISPGLQDTICLSDHGLYLKHGQEEVK